MAQTEALNNNEQVFDPTDLDIDEAELVDGGGTDEESSNSFNKVLQKINGRNDIASIDPNIAILNEELQKLYSQDDADPKRIKEIENEIDTASNAYFNNEVLPNLNNLVKGKLSREKIPPTSNIQAEEDKITITPPFDKLSNTEVVYVFYNNGKCEKTITTRLAGSNNILAKVTSVL